MPKLSWHTAAISSVCIANLQSVTTINVEAAIMRDNFPASDVSVSNGDHCQCKFCKGYDGVEGLEPADLLVCPPRTQCPQPPVSETVFSYCYGVAAGPDGLTYGTCDCESGNFLKEDKEEWIDPDTPSEARKKKFSDSGKKFYNLVFSDEFNVDGRSFDDGHDPKWTALDYSPYTNNQANTYKPDQVSIEGKKLTFKPRLSPAGNKHGMPFETAMLQSWNKFCFTGGIVEIGAKFPGMYDKSAGVQYGSGLWPAFWLMGNLARGVYTDSTEGIWPFSMATDAHCVEDGHSRSANALERQRLGPCNMTERNATNYWKPGYNLPRGSPEIDIYEIMPGKSAVPYSHRTEGLNKVCRSDTMIAEQYRDYLIGPMPLASTSFQIAPGLPNLPFMRPEWDSLHPNGDARCIPSADFWYHQLIPPIQGTNDTYHTYPGLDKPMRDPCQMDPSTVGVKCPTMPNIDFFGTRLKECQTDTWSANTFLPNESFTEETAFQAKLEWNLDASEESSNSTDKFLAWYFRLNDSDNTYPINFTKPVFQLSTSLLKPVERRYYDGTPWKLEPRRIPDEPSNLILNLDISPTWGWPCIACKLSCMTCADCKNPKCFECRDEAARQYLRENFTSPSPARKFLEDFCDRIAGEGKYKKYPERANSYLVDYIRVYSNSATCEPAGLPTKTFIGQNANNYFNESKDSYPLKCVRSGGGNCTYDTDCGSRNGECVNSSGAERVCKCRRHWTGPRCLVPAAGPSRICPFFLPEDNYSEWPAMLRPAASCQAPIPSDNHHVRQTTFTPTHGSVVEITERNCQKVFSAYAALKDNSQTRTAMLNKVTTAMRLCNLVMYDGVFGECCPEQRANIALKAWGQIVMEGAQCCNLPGPPYCIERETLWMFSSHVGPLVVSLLCIFLAAIAPLCCCRDVRFSGALLGRGRLNILEMPAVPVVPAVANTRPQELPSPPLLPDLYKEFDERTSEELKHFDSNENVMKFENSPLIRMCTDKTRAFLREPFCGVFARFGQLFGFQDDSVRNQFQHFLSLFRSQIALERDIFPDGDQTDIHLITAAMTRLHAKLMDGQKHWRKALRTSQTEVQRKWIVGMERRNLGKALKTEGGPGSIDGAFETDQLVQLADCALYLLVWGEAGNLRFCPQMIFFIVDCTLADADHAAGYTWKCPPRQPGHYLRTVIRPIYNAIFHETYDCAGSIEGKDGKRLLPDCREYSPPDAANHDDWNELFGDMNMLNERIKANTNPSKPLDQWQPGELLENLCAVNWHKCLSGVKTHREVHSFWGLFAGVHRILFLHVLLFLIAYFAAVEGLPQRKMHTNGPPMIGGNAWVRWAGIGLLGPLFFMLDSCATYAISANLATWFRTKIKSIFCLSPVVTYAVVRYFDYYRHWPAFVSSLTSLENYIVLVAHYIVSASVAGLILFVPDGFSLSSCCKGITGEQLLLWISRGLFWVSLFGAKVYLNYKSSILGTVGVLHQMGNLLFMQPQNVTISNMFTPSWDKDALFEFYVSFSTLLCFVTDTYLWITIWYSVLGALLALKARSWNVINFFFQDQVKQIRDRFIWKIIRSPPNSDLREPEGHEILQFAKIWDTVLEEMKDAEKITTNEWNMLAFNVDLAHKKDSYEMHNERVRKLEIFDEGTNLLSRFLDRSLSKHWPTNQEAQWRLHAFSRGLSLEMPRPFRVPNIPGLTILIPHYGEPILQSWDKLAPDGRGLNKEMSDAFNREVILLRWIIRRYKDEYDNLSSHADELSRITNFQYNVNAIVKAKLEFWATMRTQTLFRTVEGMCKYSKALDLLADLSPDKLFTSAKRSFHPSDCFRCLVAMQQYASLDLPQLKHVETMLERWPEVLSIAYIDYKDADPLACIHAGVHCNQATHTFEPGDMGIDYDDNGFVEKVRSARSKVMGIKVGSRIVRIHVHAEKDTESFSKGAVRRAENSGGSYEVTFQVSKQNRFYFACLFDAKCKVDGYRRVPRFRVELPGYPILGNGKGDNQNCAIIFSRGEFIQAIDSNQGGYLEQWLLMPTILGEFRDDPRRLIGCAEHIISDFGSIGDFAASAEVAFGTILQRTMTALGGRFHYGHPDVMNKIYMMHQGGVSKATQTLHLSEDIFAGMDFTLRGGTIRHKEYFHVAKGRDLGFAAVLSFFSKLSAGTGEQVITRQFIRLLRRFGLERTFPMYYNHAGFYFTQYLFSVSVKMPTYVMMLATFSDFDAYADSLNTRYPFRGRPEDLQKEWTQLKGSTIMCAWISSLFGPIFVLFILSTSLPLLVELWFQRGIFVALGCFFKQMLTAAPLHFTFQGKVIGEYVVREIRYGGATYIATGRELPTHRRPFVGPDKEWVGVSPSCTTGIKEKKGLYEEFAEIGHYDGVRLLIVVMAITPFVEQWDHFWPFMVSVCMVIISWMWTPYIYNPYQFDFNRIRTDVQNWYGFFCHGRSERWAKWWSSNLKLGVGLRATPLLLVVWLLYVVPVYVLLQEKLNAYVLFYGVTEGSYLKDLFKNPARVARVLALSPSLMSPVLGGPLLFLVRLKLRANPSPLLCFFVVLFFGLLEVAFAVYPFIVAKPKLGLCAANVVLYKVVAIDFLCFIAGAILNIKKPPPQPESAISTHDGPVMLWLRGVALLRDLVVSLMIILPLLIFASLSWLVSKALCVFNRSGHHRCPLHNLFVFRSRGEYGNQFVEVRSQSRDGISMPILP